MNYTITGGAGFIGSHLAKALLQQGHGLDIIDLANLFIKYSKKDLKPKLGQELEGNVRASQADISLAKSLLGWRPQTKLEDWVETLFKK